MHAYTDKLAQRRPLWMVTLAIDETNLSEGLRAACASSAMLLLGLLFDHPDFSWAAIGAFWTCLADAAGTRRMRFVSMLGFGLLSTVAGGLTARLKRGALRVRGPRATVPRVGAQPSGGSQ